MDRQLTELPKGEHDDDKTVGTAHATDTATDDTGERGEEPILYLCMSVCPFLRGYFNSHDNKDIFMQSFYNTIFKLNKSNCLA